VSRVSTTPTAEALLAENRQRKTAWLTTRILELDAAEQARLVDALDVLDRLTAMDPE
jgi:hypothetical protein